MTSEAKITLQNNILVVDDVPENLQLLGGLLRQLGYSVRMANSGPVALESARLRPPDLVLMDVKMPVMDGYEVCAQFKREPLLQRIPVIFISAYGQLEDKVKAFQVGGVDYVTKPFRVEEVEARVRTHLEIHRLEQQILGHNARLEQAVAERTRDLADSNARLAQLDQAKTDFLNIISHELRTPLSVLLGVTELTFAEFPEHPQVVAFQKMFEDSRRRLLRLIDDALLLSSMKVNDTRMACQPVSLKDLLARAAEEARPAAEERQVRLELRAGLPAMVAGDPFLLAKALGYILKAGAIFSKNGCKLIAETVVAEEEVVVVARAEGYTVPEDQLPRFFDLLAFGKTQSPGGDLGLSLPVAAQIINLLGGRVEVANVDPAGIRLRVTLRRLPDVVTAVEAMAV